ncbi:MAG: precorrin-2 C(20)-methyltransferase [Alphaproteobacteria bacterium]
MTGTLYGLGVGPGDPDLITLKALRILQAAKVVAYPAPEQGESLARAIVAPHLPGGQREIAIRMKLVPGAFPDAGIYDGAAAEIGAELDAGFDVAVICEGDPFFYGSFMYLFARVNQSHRVEVVPGVSSLTACAAALGAPLASLNDVLSVVPGPLDAETMKARLADAEAAAIIKVGRHFEKIRGVLDELGLADCARYIAHATLPEQTLLALDQVDPADVPYFSMILVHKRREAWK